MRSTSLLITDTQQTVIARAQAGASQSSRYDPWGAGSPTVADGTAMGFNGEPLERGVPLYLLGNGRRAYLPRLRRFSSPDPLAPFGTGQLNPYGYVLGDPVNLRDPTGLSPESISAIMSITFHVLIIFGNLAPVGIAHMMGAAMPRLTQLGTAFGLAGSATTITGASMTLANHPNARLVSQVGTGLSITGFALKMPETVGKLRTAYQHYKRVKAEQNQVASRRGSFELGSQGRAQPVNLAPAPAPPPVPQASANAAMAGTQLGVGATSTMLDLGSLAVGLSYSKKSAPQAATDRLKIGPTSAGHRPVASEARRIRG